MKLHADSHLDHGITDPQLGYLLSRFGDHGRFFTATVELPADLGTVSCGLYGPLVGDPPIADAEVSLEVRGTRAWSSRVIARPARPTRLVTIIAGPHDGEPCVVYTIFGGPLAPQEPGDPGCKDPAASAAFWGEHALAR